MAIIFTDTDTSTPFADIHVNTDICVFFLCFASPFPKYQIGVCLEQDNSRKQYYCVQNGKLFSKLTTLDCTCSSISSFRFEFSTVVKQVKACCLSVKHCLQDEFFCEDLLTDAFKVKLGTQIKTFSIMEV